MAMCRARYEGYFMKDYDSLSLEKEKIRKLERELEFTQKRLERFTNHKLYKIARRIRVFSANARVFPRILKTYTPLLGRYAFTKSRSDVPNSSAHVEGSLLNLRGNRDDLSRALIKASKILAENDLVEASVHTARAAISVLPSTSSYSAFFWAVQKAGDLRSARDAIIEIERLTLNAPTARGLARLEKLKSQPAYQLELQRLVPDPATDPQHMVPHSGKLCYVLHNSLPYSSGGYATRAQGLAVGLQSIGITTAAITRPGYPLDVKAELSAEALPLTDEVQGITYIRAPHPRRKGNVLREYIPEAANELKQIITKQNPSVVAAASNYIAALPALIAARELGLPFVYEVRGFWEVTRLSRQPSYLKEPSYKIQEEMETFVCNSADKVVTLTQAMREELIRRGVAAEKIFLVPNACEPDRFVPRRRSPELASRLAIPDEVPVIGYVGTFVDYEGLDDLAQACGLLKEAGHAFRLLLVGNENTSGKDRGPITDDILRCAREYNFEEWLILPGRVPHEEVSEFYSLIDIAPFPRKPWPVCEMVSPMKPLEALAMEKAVVVSDVSALAEMVPDRERGLHFEKGSVTSLFQALEELVLSPELRQQLGRRGRKWVMEERTWEHSARAFAEVISLPYSVTKAI